MEIEAAAMRPQSHVRWLARVPANLKHQLCGSSLPGDIGTRLAGIAADVEHWRCGHRPTRCPPVKLRFGFFRDWRDRGRGEEKKNKNKRRPPVFPPDINDPVSLSPPPIPLFDSHGDHYGADDDDPEAA